MKTEVNYLVVFDKKKLQYSTVDKLTKLIGLIDNIEIKQDQIEYSDSKFSFVINEEKIETTEHSKLMVIDLTISSHSNEKDIESLSNLLREIRILVTNNLGEITPVFDGVSAFYAEKAYPQVHYIENLMRQLFSKFLLIKLGPSWADSIPKNITTRSNGKTTNPLYDLDFIQINDVLFNEYASKEADSTFLKSLKEGSFANKYIEEYIPQSNWIRYFQPIVKCEASYLQKRWEKLYSQRNKIAHNKLFTKDDFEEVKKITSEIKSKLLPAISKIGTIEIGKSIIPEKVAEKAMEGELITADKKVVNLPSKSDSSGDGAGLLLLGLFGAFIAASSSSK